MLYYYAGECMMIMPALLNMCVGPLVIAVLN